MNGPIIARTPKRQMQTGLNRIRSNIANSMVGRQVALLVGQGLTAEGIVAGVQLEAGRPKLVVAGLKYDLRQVLTVAPVMAS